MSNWSEGTTDEESYSWSCNRCGREYDLDHYNDIDDHVDTHRDQYGQLRDFDEPEAPEGYQMVMRFVLTTDNGGPYDPEAFTSGWNLGMIDALLGAARAIRAIPEPQTIRPVEMQQVEMLAMKHGVLVSFTSIGPGWELATFALPADQLPDML